MSRDSSQFLRAIERFALVLEEAGMPRMSARMYAYMLIDGHGPYSAAALSEALHVSAAAISGATRSLVAARVVVKEREPGSRLDLYRVTADVATAMTRLRADQFQVWQASAEEAALMLGPRTRSGRRMQEAAEFLSFSRTRLLDLADEWRKREGR